MLTSRRTTDPEMDQELYTLGCMLHITAKDMTTKGGRLSWMDGSECDDGDQHNWNSVRKDAENQPRSGITIVII